MTDIVSIPLIGIRWGIMRAARAAIVRAVVADMQEIRAEWRDLSNQVLDNGETVDLRGQYDPKTRTIALRTRGSHFEQVFAHEFGHAYLIDVVYKTLSRFSPHQREQLIGPLYNAINASDAIKAVHAFQRTGSITQARATYLLDKEELFCRAFAQYVAQVSRSGPMLDSVKYLSENVSARAPEQWTDQDFEPIAIEMKKLFRQLGTLSR